VRMSRLGQHLFKHQPRLRPAAELNELAGRFDDGVVVEPHLRGHVPPVDSLTR
jgi:hypothetical protein